MLNHDNFYNRVRSGYEELMSYYPNFWKGILEMQANNKFAGHTLDRAAGDMEQVVLDQFFDTCSETMVARYEDFLGLERPDADLGERRRFLKMAWKGDSKMNRTKITGIIKEYCGSDCRVSLTDRQLIIDMVFHGNPALYMPKVRKFLNTSTIPAHIGIVYKGTTDLAIRIVWQCILGIQSIIYKPEFKMNHPIMCLDRALPLGASGLQREIYDWFVTSLGNVVQLSVQEYFGIAPTIQTVAMARFHASGTIILKVGHGLGEYVRNITANKLNIGQGEIFMADVTIEKNLHCLDGSMLLGKAMLLNSYIKKEDFDMSESIVTNLAKGKTVKARAGITDILPKIVGMAFGNGAKEGDGYRVPLPTDISLQNELLRQGIDNATLQEDGISVLYTCTLAKETLGGETINEIGLYDEDGDLVAIKSFSDKGKDNDMEMIFHVLDKFSD